MNFRLSILQKLLKITFFLSFLPCNSFSQTSFDLNGIWISDDYRCYEIEGNTWNFFTVESEVLVVTQNANGFVSAMKCIGDKCVPAGYVSWSGYLTDSTISGGYFIIGTIACPGCGYTPIELSVMNDSLMTSNVNTNFRKISCAEYRKVVMPKYGTYYDCQLCSEYFEIPNVFTPNGDEVNDEWAFYLPQDASLLNFDIYDRWGVLTKTVIKKKPKKDASHISKEKWDGNSMGGAPCSSGVYFYTIKYLDANNETKSKSGYIQLFRE